MGVNSLPIRLLPDSDLNPGPSAPESSTLTTRLPSHPRPRRGSSHESVRPCTLAAAGARGPKLQRYATE